MFDHEWESHQFQIIILFLLDIRMEVRFQSAALEAVQEAAECYIVSTLILPEFCSKLGRFLRFLNNQLELIFEISFKVFLLFQLNFAVF